MQFVVRDLSTLLADAKVKTSKAGGGGLAYAIH
jgi:hypothetical protein